MGLFKIDLIVTLINRCSMTDDMDFNAGAILNEDMSLEEAGRAIYEDWLRYASGEKTKSELQGLGDFEFVPWQIGATM